VVLTFPLGRGVQCVLVVVSVGVGSDLCPANQGEHDWHSYGHNTRRCRGCLRIEKSGCHCEDCILTLDEWKAKRRREVAALDDPDYQLPTCEPYDYTPVAGVSLEYLTEKALLEKKQREAQHEHLPKSRL